METRLSDNLRKVIVYSRNEAIRLSSANIGVEHFFLGILRSEESVACQILHELDLNLQYYKTQIDKLLSSSSSNVSIANDSEIPMLRQAEKVLRLSFLESTKLHQKEIHTEHLLLAILVEGENTVAAMLEKDGVNYDAVFTTIKKHYGDTSNENPAALESNNNPVFNESRDDDDDGYEDPYPSQRSSQSPSYKHGNSDTPALDNFGRDLTEMAREGKLDPMVGREKELERIAQTLSRRKKNNPVLIGEPGVGKSAIVEGLAQKIVEGRVPRTLYRKRIVVLDLAGMVAGTKFRGQFEERMKAILSELEKHHEIIVFIDEIHTIIGAGSASGSLDASNMLKPALARGDLQCIGATTLDEYRQYIEKDGAVERRFQKIIVDPSTSAETLQILRNVKVKYEDHHKVVYTEEALQACVNLTERYISDRLLPDKALDALDEAGARVRIHNINVPQEITDAEMKLEAVAEQKKIMVAEKKYNDAAKLRDEENQLSNSLMEMKKKWDSEENSRRIKVTENDIAEVVATISGVPVQRIAQSESIKLMNMEQQLQGVVIGQDEAIRHVCRAIRRNRAGLKDPNHPIGSFFFLGSTGVGKTYLTKVLAKFLFDSEEAMIRIDMSEYMEKFSVSRLIGAPPGYVGYEEGGQLTEKVRRKPYSIVLLDEIEKAHPDVFNVLLQVLDDGQLTDGQGRKVDFRNTIIIMTSNIGARQLKDFGTGVGFNTTARANERDAMERDVIEKELRKKFAPEFLNRVDDIVYFKNLKRDEIHKIIDIELRDLFRRVKDMGYGVNIDENAKDFLLAKGWDENFGARPLKRAIQHYIEDDLADEIIKSELIPGDTIHITTQNTAKKTEQAADTNDANGDNKIVFKIEKGTMSKVFASDGIPAPDAPLPSPTEA